MNELDEFELYITYLSQKLQKPAEFVYDMLLRQVWFEGAWSAVGLLAGLLLILIGRKAWRRPGDENDYDVPHIFVPVSCLVVGPIMFFVNLYWLMQIAINPHWYMVKMVGKIVAGK